MKSSGRYFVVLIWVRPGALDVLHEYEKGVKPLIEEHGGSFDVVATIDESRDSSPDESLFRAPDEVHVLHFKDSAGFDAYRADPRGEAFAHLRETSVERVLFLAGDPVDLFD